MTKSALMIKQIQVPSRNSFVNLASDLDAKLPPSSNKSRISSVHIYYQNILDLLTSKFKLSNVIEDFALKLLKDLNIDEAVGIDNLSGKFLKDRANILAKPISNICNLFIKYSFFPTDYQIGKLNRYSKRVPQHFLEIIGQFRYSL